MKYWRGYLTAAILLFFSIALQKFAETHTVLIDMVYPYVSRMIQDFLAGWSGTVDFCVWQLAVVVFAVVVLATLVLLVIFRWNPIQWLGWIAAVVSLVFFLHTGMYGLNYYAGPLAEDIRLEMADYTLSELERATVYYRDKANTYAELIRRDGQNNPVYPEFRELAEQAGEGFQTLVYEKSYAVFAGSTEPVKELGWADMYTSMGITGFTLSITGEAAVNPQIPVVSLPFTMCHEMAHRTCIASERDANMAAFLACSENSSVEYQYSAYFMAFRYCYNAIAGVGARESASRVSSGMSDLLRQDMNAYDDFFATHKDEVATEVATTVNDSYIKVNGDEQGVASYGEVCDLLVSWHIQQVILPMHLDEEVQFDPYDETQVDLTGLVPATNG